MRGDLVLRLVAAAAPSAASRPRALGLALAALLGLIGAACDAAGGDGAGAREGAGPPAALRVDPAGSAPMDAGEGATKDGTGNGDVPSTEAGVDGPAASATPASPPSPTPSPTPALRLSRLTEPGCCPLPFWGPDGREVRFWFAPPEGPPGLYALPAPDAGAGQTASAETTPRLVEEGPVGLISRGAFTFRREGQVGLLRRSADGREWRLDTGDGTPLVSPDGTRAAWGARVGRFVPGGPPPQLRHALLDLESGEESAVAVPREYGFLGWTADGAWLVSRIDSDFDVPALARFDPASGELAPLFDGERLRATELAPGGRWLAVTRSAEADPAANGLFLLDTEGAAEPRRVEPFGGYRWRDGERLLLVPQRPGAPMELWQVDAASGEAAPLTRADELPFRIAAGEWSVAPTGEAIAFRSAEDDAIHVLRLPPAAE